MSKILYLGKFNTSYSTEVYVSYALRRLGQTVEAIPHNELGARSSWDDYLSKHSPDVVMFSKAPVAGCRELINACKRRGIITVAWVWDLYFECGNRPEKDWPQFEADLVFTSDGGHSDDFKARGWNHCTLRQGIHFPEAVAQPPDHKFLVGFVGHKNGKFQPGRQELVQHLQTTYGDQFTHAETVRGLDLNKWLASVCVVVGDSYPTSTGGYWSNRIYEVTGRGGFMLHPDIRGLNNEFKAGLHIGTYDRGDLEDLDNKINFYASEPDVREEIRRNGHILCKTHYTYVERCRTLLNHIGAYRVSKATN